MEGSWHQGALEALRSRRAELSQRVRDIDARAAVIRQHAGATAEEVAAAYAAQDAARTQELVQHAHELRTQLAAQQEFTARCMAHEGSHERAVREMETSVAGDRARQEELQGRLDAARRQAAALRAAIDGDASQREARAGELEAVERAMEELQEEQLETEARITAAAERHAQFTSEVRDMSVDTDALVAEEAALQHAVVVADAEATSWPPNDVVAQREARAAAARAALQEQLAALAAEREAAATTLESVSRDIAEAELRARQAPRPPPCGGGSNGAFSAAPIEAVFDAGVAIVHQTLEALVREEAELTEQLKAAETKLGMVEADAQMNLARAMRSAEQQLRRLERGGVQASLMTEAMAEVQRALTESMRLQQQAAQARVHSLLGQVASVRRARSQHEGLVARLERGQGAAAEKIARARASQGRLSY